MNHRPQKLGLLILVAIMSSGCTAGEQTFDGYAANSVWLALQAAARLPGYDDLEPGLRWRIDANDVYVDEDGRRIEIHREISRLEWIDIRKPTRRERAFDFEVLMVGFDPPAATMAARGPHLPGQAALEAERYFASVREILGPALTPSGPPPEGDPAATSAPPATLPDAAPVTTKAVVDIEEVDPGL